jgi:DNA-directed RNA polymerase specialized sigma24 family protein
MGFNYAEEKKKFDQEWEKLKVEYEQAGMSDEMIQKMHDYDWAEFRAQRPYKNRVQMMPDPYSSEDDPESQSTLIQKFEQLRTSFDESDFEGRYSWVDSVEHPQLSATLKMLSEEELELLTYLVLEEHTQVELAKKWGCSQRAISYKMTKLKKFFKNASKKRLLDAYTVRG